MSIDAPLVYTRLPNKDQGDYIKFPAYLVSNNLAIAIFGEHLEIHRVKPTDDSDESDLVEQSNPMFFVGNNVQAVFHDIGICRWCSLQGSKSMVISGSQCNMRNETLIQLRGKRKRKEVAKAIRIPKCT